MKFLVDQQLPPALARWLTTRNFAAAHTSELGLGAAEDTDIWTRACSDGLIVVSKDEDFFALANRLRDTGCLLWVRIGNCRRVELLRRFEADWSQIEEAFRQGQRIVELR